MTRNALVLARTAPARLSATVSSRLHATRAADGGPSDAGMTTAEYAVGTVAACGFGGVLVEVLKDDGIQSMLTRVLLKALSLAGLG